MYAFEQDVPINAAVYARIIDGIGAALAAAGLDATSEPPRREVTVVDAWGTGFPQRVAL